MSGHRVEFRYEQDLAMEKASEVFATRLNLARAGVDLKPQHDLIWRIPFQGRGPVPGSQSWFRSERARAAMDERESFVESLRVNRDPCPRCNTRRDIGCKHFPVQP